MRFNHAVGHVLLILFSSVVVAKEPINIFEARNALIKYHDSGEYERDIEKVTQDAMRYLKLALQQGMPAGKKPAIILDVDETALSNYPSMLKMNFGGTMEHIRAAEAEGNDPVIMPILKLYRFAKQNNVAVFFITGRREAQRDVTARNLQTAGYTDWDGLFLRTPQYESASAAEYKTAMRRKIVAEGYHITLNVGDQKSDLSGSYNGRGFKLPGPFYYIK